MYIHLNTAFVHMCETCEIHNHVGPLEDIELDSAEKNGNAKLLHAVVSLLGDLCHYFIDPPDLSVPRQHFGDGGGLGFGILELGRRCSSYLLHVHFFECHLKGEMLAAIFVWGGICTTFPVLFTFCIQIWDGFFLKMMNLHGRGPGGKG